MGVTRKIAIEDPSERVFLLKSNFPMKLLEIDVRIRINQIVILLDTGGENLNPKTSY
jgi:hypothetical protein